MKQNIELQAQEIDEVLSIIKFRYGYDFTAYAKASIQRRVQRFMQDVGLHTAFELKHYLVNEPQGFDRFLEKITVNVTEMFRDPAFYNAIRQNVIPMLSSYPIIKIWHAGCSTGEEVFSMAIILYEAGLLQRTRIYATDINPANIEKAKKAIISLDAMKDYTGNYIKSGGLNDFANYYTARYNNAIINKELRSNIVFSQHNLVTDNVFNEFQMVCCRNVMIYFNKDLQSRAINLFNESLSPLGYLALGTKETLLFTKLKNEFELVDQQQKIYRKTR